MSITIREAKPGDGPALHRLVRELADHHDELDRVVSTPEPWKPDYVLRLNVTDA